MDETGCLEGVRITPNWPGLERQAQRGWWENSHRHARAATKPLVCAKSPKIQTIIVYVYKTIIVYVYKCAAVGYNEDLFNILARPYIFCCRRGPFGLRRTKGNRPYTTVTFT